MSTLKTHNIQSPDAGSVNIALAPNAGMVVAGLSTYSNQINVGSNIKLGTAGVVTATSFVGSGANLTNLPSQVTINNATANRVLTSDGGTTLNGEANLTFDGGQLFTQSTGNQDPLVVNSTYANKKLIVRETSDANSNGGIRIQKKHSSLHPANYWYGDIAFQGWDGDEYRRAGLIECVAEGTPANDNMPGQLRFSTNSGTTTQTERFRITSSGQLRLMEGNSVKMSVYHDSSGGLNHITSNNGNEIKVSCGNGDSNGIEFWDYTGTNKRCQIDGHGIKFNSDTAQDNALDDYEEGSFTPRLGPHNNHSIYENGTGKYTKIGNTITYCMSWQNKNATSFPTNARIEIWNLPFTFQMNNSGEHQVMPSLMMHNVQFAANEKHYFYTLQNSNNMLGLKSRDGNSWIEWGTADWNQSSLYLDASGTFFVN